MCTFAINIAIFHTMKAKILFIIALLLMVMQGTWGAIAVDGKLPGAFSVSATKQIWFSQGNLQYQANSTGATEAPYTGVWRFATNQYEAIGSGNSNVSASYDGWIDSFGWGSGNQPTQTSEASSVYSTFVDWGTNAISNGGNTANLWRTLSESEWTYLVFTRPNASSKRGRATINGMYCFVLLPDDWVLPSGLSFTPDANNWTNEYTTEQWIQMEDAGAVCFPAAGSRAGGTNNTNVNDYNRWCCYWSSTSANSSQGYNLWITSDHVGTTDKGNYQMGASVRLVSETMFPGSGTEEVPYLISSEAAWNYLADQVNSGTNYVGKSFRLTNDISVTTMVGSSESNSFRGTFDGYGHTLTINYNTTSDYTAPFRYIQGATFKNLKVTGSITTTMNLAAGIAGLNTGATATFEQCVTDIIINSSSSTVVGWGRYDYHGGLLARTIDVDAMITDCVCGGSVNGSSSSNSNCASFVGVAENCTVHATRCLSTTSYTNVNKWNSLSHCADNAYRAVNVFYYVNANDAANVGEQVTTSQLADGTITTALQAGRATTVWTQYAAISQPMLRLFALNQANDGYYLIGSEQEWRNFAALILTTPTAKAKMTADISVTTMVGTGSGDDATHSFCGTFDGQGHTLTFNISASEDLVAPFRYIDGATIKNLIVGGNNTSSARYNAGMVALSDGAVTITNCVVSATMTNNVVKTDWEDGNSACGGFIAEIHTGSATLNGCRFSGKILGSANSFGGFVGWSWMNDNAANVFNNCLFAPIELKENASDTKTYCRNLGSITCNNSYYLTVFGDAQGKQARSISAGDDVTISGLGAASATYDVSGIIAYAHGIKYNDVFYAGNGDEVSLTLSHDDNPGSTFSHYVVTGGGSFDDSTSNTPTLTMTDANQTINAEWLENTATLSQATDNSTFISANNGLVYDITLGRTINAGGWNTFAVPFGINPIPTGWTVKKLTGASNDGSTLTLTFGDATSIEAGKPYLVKVTATAENPTFDDVTISSSTTPTVITGVVSFVPVINPTALTAGDKTKLFVTGGNKLTYPNTTGNINGFRAYFQLPSEQAARQFVLNFGEGDPTVVGEIQDSGFRIQDSGDDAWYDLSGRKYDSKPTKPGVYVHKGEKVSL